MLREEKVLRFRKIIIEIPEIAPRNAHLLSQLRFLLLSALIFTKDKTDYFLIFPPIGPA